MYRCKPRSKKLKVSKTGTADGLSALPKESRANGLVVKLGATLEIRITAAARIGKVVRYRIVKNKFPKAIVLCLAPGATRPAACA